MPLLEPSDMPHVAGTRVPHDFYLVTRDPAPLAGMAYPDWEGLSWGALAELGLVHVVCLSEQRIAYVPSPLAPPFHMPLEDLFGGRYPKEPDREETKVRRAAAAALAWLRAGEGVVVHCDGGTGRTGTVLGCVLRGLGCSAEEVLVYLDRITKDRGGEQWPESPWQGDVVRRFVE